MANIQTYLQRIKSAIYGREVRDSIHDAIDAINTEVEEAHDEIDEFVQSEMDTTLTSTELPAQGKAVGDAIEDVVIASDTQPTSEFNQIWIDEDGETEYQVPTYSEFSEVKNALTQLGTVPKIAGTDAVNVDLDITDTDGNVLVRLSNGHIQTKEFDSTDVNDDIADLKSEKIDVAQGVANAGKALVVGADGDVSPEDITIELDDTLTQQGEAADAKAVGDAIDDVEDSIAEVNYNLGKFPEVKNTSDADSDLFITDSDGNALVQFADGHIKTKNFDSETTVSEQDIEDIETSVSELGSAVGKSPETRSTNAQDVDLDLVDQNGNVLARFEDGHIKTKNFDSSMSDQNAVKTVNNTAPDANGNVNVRAELDPEEVETAVSDYLDEHPVVASAAGIVSVADYGAVGDGVTDDSAAIQNAVNSNYDVYFESNKSYYVASTISINHDIRLHGGLNTKIITKTPSGGTVNTAFSISGTLKSTTTLTSDYVPVGTTDNSGNKFTLSDMTGVEIGDIIVITATDQYYSLSRQYYYLGAALLVCDVNDGHLFTNISMPWGITNTSSVSVKVYSAPTPIIENITFESDLETIGQYRYMVSLNYCKNAVIRNCNIGRTFNCIIIGKCVNTLIDCLSMYKSKWDNAISADGYGIYVGSCTDTCIRRLESICAQGCIDLSGDIPNINTHISNSSFASECRVVGLDMHPNSYNLVVEDCTIGGAAITGTAYVNRCRFIRNNRVSGATSAIAYRGDYNPEWTKLCVTNCTFDGSLGVQLIISATQNPIRAYDSIIGEVQISDCNGGNLLLLGAPSSSVTAHIIKQLIINRWEKCYEFYHEIGPVVEFVEVNDSTFVTDYWINRHNSALVYDGINQLRVKSVHPQIDRLFVDLQKNGANYILPENIPIVFSSDTTNAHYVVCGKNISSDNPNDYSVGFVSGNVGEALTRTVNSSFSNSITVDQDGNIVFTQPNNTSNVYIYPKCMVYANEKCRIRMKAQVVNSGQTSGATFRPYIVVVNCETGKITRKTNGEAVQATSSGVNISHTEFFVPAGAIAMCYLYCNAPVAQSITTFEDFVVNMNPLDFDKPAVYEKYEGSSADGDDTLLSVAGINHIMSDVVSFNAKFKVDFMEV